MIDQINVWHKIPTNSVTRKYEHLLEVAVAVQVQKRGLHQEALAVGACDPVLLALGHDLVQVDHSCFLKH